MMFIMSILIFLSLCLQLVPDFEIETRFTVDLQLASWRILPRSLTQLLLPVRLAIWTNQTWGIYVITTWQHFNTGLESRHDDNKGFTQPAQLKVKYLKVLYWIVCLAAHYYWLPINMDIIYGSVYFVDYNFRKKDNVHYN